LGTTIVASIVCQIIDDELNHTILILQGEQGIGKTTWLNSIIPRQLKNYVYSGSINPNNKDTLIHMSECGWIMMDELTSMKGINNEKIKELITQGIIRQRRPYEQFSKNMIRRASFMGTTNNLQFLSDSTGNRRFLPFEVIEINYNHGINMDLVYAQAYHLYITGFQFWFDKNEVQQIQKHNTQFEKRSFEEDLVLQIFDKCESNDGEVYWNATMVMQYLHSRGLIPQSDRTKQHLGAILTKYFNRTKKDGLYVYALKFRINNSDN
jgi:predicted P-loop ATPase